MMIRLRWINDVDCDWVDESYLKVNSLQNSSETLTVDLQDCHCQILSPSHPRVQPLHHRECSNDRSQVGDAEAEQGHPSQQDPSQSIEAMFVCAVHWW